MPEGLLEGLTTEQARDLIAYLMHTGQVPMPSVAKFSSNWPGSVRLPRRKGERERSRKEWGAQPPRLVFGAPRAELYTGRNANGEGAVGSARGGRAPRFQSNRSA